MRPVALHTIGDVSGHPLRRNFPLLSLAGWESGAWAVQPLTLSSSSEQEQQKQQKQRSLYHLQNQLQSSSENARCYFFGGAPRSVDEPPNNDRIFMLTIVRDLASTHASTLQPPGPALAESPSIPRREQQYARPRHLTRAPVRHVWCEVRYNRNGPTSSRPCPRDGHVFVALDDAGRYLLLFGGVVDGNCLSDCYIFDTIAAEWTPLLPFSSSSKADKKDHSTIPSSSLMEPSSTSSLPSPSTPSMSLDSSAAGAQSQQPSVIDINQSEDATGNSNNLESNEVGPQLLQYDAADDNSYQLPLPRARASCTRWHNTIFFFGGSLSEVGEFQAFADSLQSVTIQNLDQGGPANAVATWSPVMRLPLDDALARRMARSSHMTQNALLSVIGDDQLIMALPWGVSHRILLLTMQLKDYHKDPISAVKSMRVELVAPTWLPRTVPSTSNQQQQQQQQQQPAKKQSSKHPHAMPMSLHAYGDRAVLWIHAVDVAGFFELVRRYQEDPKKVSTEHSGVNELEGWLGVSDESSIPRHKRFASGAGLDGHISPEESVRNNFMSHHDDESDSVNSYTSRSTSPTKTNVPDSMNSSSSSRRITNSKNINMNDENYNSKNKSSLASGWDAPVNNLCWSDFGFGGSPAHDNASPNGSDGITRWDGQQSKSSNGDNRNSGANWDTGSSGDNANKASNNSVNWDNRNNSASGWDSQISSWESNYIDLGGTSSSNEMDSSSNSRPIWTLPASIPSTGPSPVLSRMDSMNQDSEGSSTIKSASTELPPLSPWAIQSLKRMETAPWISSNNSGSDSENSPQRITRHMQRGAELGWAFENIASATKLPSSSAAAASTASKKEKEKAIKDAQRTTESLWIEKRLASKLEWDATRENEVKNSWQTLTPAPSFYDPSSSMSSSSNWDAVVLPDFASSSSFSSSLPTTEQQHLQQEQGRQRQRRNQNQNQNQNRVQQQQQQEEQQQQDNWQILSQLPISKIIGNWQEKKRRNSLERISVTTAEGHPPTIGAAWGLEERSSWDNKDSIFSFKRTLVTMGIDDEEGVIWTLIDPGDQVASTCIESFGIYPFTPTWDLPDLKMPSMLEEQIWLLRTELDLDNEQVTATDQWKPDFIIQSSLDKTSVTVDSEQLRSRWSHLDLMLSSGMRELGESRLVMEECGATIRAFLFYLYYGRLPLPSDLPVEKLLQQGHGAVLLISSPTEPIPTPRAAPSTATSSTEIANSTSLNLNDNQEEDFLQSPPSAHRPRVLSPQMLHDTATSEHNVSCIPCLQSPPLIHTNSFSTTTNTTVTVATTVISNTSSSDSIEAVSIPEHRQSSLQETGDVHQREQQPSDASQIQTDLKPVVDDSPEMSPHSAHASASGAKSSKNKDPSNTPSHSTTSLLWMHVFGDANGLPLPGNVLHELWQIGNMYSLPHLQHTIRQYLMDSIVLQNVAAVFAFAVESHMHGLRVRCENFMFNSFEQVRPTVAFRRLSREMLSEIPWVFSRMQAMHAPTSSARRQLK